MIKWEFLGRLHPLVLHLPIGLIFGLLLIEGLALIIDRGARTWQVCRRAYIALLSLSCMAAAATGYLLSLEGQVDGVILTRHKWSGVSAAAVSLVLLSLAVKGRQQAGTEAIGIFEHEPRLVAGNKGVQETDARGADRAPPAAAARPGAGAGSAGAPMGESPRTLPEAAEKDAASGRDRAQERRLESGDCHAHERTLPVPEWLAGRAPSHGRAPRGKSLRRRNAPRQTA